MIVTGNLRNALEHGGSIRVHSTVMRGWRVVGWRLVLLLMGASVAFLGAAAEGDPSKAAEQPEKSGKAAEAAAFFAGPIQRFEITVPAKQLQKLRRQPREYVSATVVVGTNRFDDVALKLKGAAGSSRPWEDKPALTLNFDKLRDGQHCFGLDKLHLNNSVQDRSCLNELIASELYRQSGLPTARATHALVTLNGRDVGLYVLKEGYDNLFLKRNFPVGTNGPGNLYDGGFLHDVDQGLERDVGSGPDSQKDLQALARAANEPLRNRRARLESVLDVERFITFLVGQALTDDWDGYGRNRNNYRVYFAPPDGRAVFIPHGMDQLFREPESGLNPDWSGLVAHSVMDVPEFRQRYHARLKEMATNAFSHAVISNQLSQIVGRLQSVITNRPAHEVMDLERALRSQQRKILRRVVHVERKLGLQSSVAANGSGEVPAVIVPSDPWRPRSRTGNWKAEQVVAKNGGTVLYLSALSRGTVASYRTSQYLPEGRYTFEGRVLVRGVKGGEGARLRISGSQTDQGLQGDHDWTPVQFDFWVDSERDVELVLELAADGGEAWFDMASLRILRR